MKEDRCPFLECRTVSYCKAFPVKKMIPVEESSRDSGLCSTRKYRECAAYREIEHREAGPDAIRGFRLKSGCYYHPRHLWIDFSGEEDGEARIGVDDFAQKILGPVDRVSVPPEGTSVKENSVIFLLHSGTRTVRMVSPGDGVVRAVNPGIEADPGIINRDPYDDGWVLSLQLVEAGVDRLYHGNVAKKWLESEADRLQRMFSQDLGLTATDGGEFLPDLGGRLNDAQWRRIATLFLG